MNSLKVVKVGTHGFYDVFTGNGWYNHIRIRMVKGNILVLPEKARLTDEIKQQIISLVKQGRTKFSNYKFIN